MTLQTRVVPLLCLSLAVGCRSPAPDEAFRPTESILEVLSVLRLHLDDDTYRFPPARDLTGRNVYAATLRRLESLEAIYGERFRSGYMVDVILFAKGRALERIGEYELAARHYARVTELGSVLREPSQVSMELCEQIHAAAQIAPRPTATAEQALSSFDGRIHQLEELLRKAGSSHYRHIVREEIERADRERAEYFDARRAFDLELEIVALQQYQKLVQRHAESKNRNRHLLDLADFYAALSRSYTARHPATSLGFDPATFDEYGFGATRLYEAVSRQDGAIEKIEAARKLEAYLAFSLQVHADKLPR